VLNLDDTRTPAQQQQTQKAASTDQKLAKELEKQRLAQEKQAASQARKSVKQELTAQPPAAAASTKPALAKITPKRQRSKAKNPADFIAEMPGSKKETQVKKSAKKTASATR